ncbi:uncharacterized protein BBA_09555 [Beauveria bassiana ARSEF 2860]|uniref:Uncharacterized protein n=1 Tax=Beauveria bassiana (strain ARSEF 2860) TaxID=655819 RepID=J5JC42_BEAB2|nr:uncharacterized protein BBA_09555 [Beauveria bassiana ARSEF 2860]EJP61476.1 hypothetical protein BBA_09555 [Beauveria bassiana ARSEF 2860]
MRFYILLGLAAMAMAAATGELGSDLAPPESLNTTTSDEGTADYDGGNVVYSCYWEGSAPFCRGRCKSGWRECLHI